MIKWWFSITMLVITRGYLLEDDESQIVANWDMTRFSTAILPPAPSYPSPGDSGGRQRDGCHGQYHCCGNWRPRRTLRRQSLIWGMLVFFPTCIFRISTVYMYNLSPWMSLDAYIGFGQANVVRLLTFLFGMSFGKLKGSACLFCKPRDPLSRMSHTSLVHPYVGA